MSDDLEDRVIDELNANKPWWMAAWLWLSRLDWEAAVASRPHRYWQ